MRQLSAEQLEAFSLAVSKAMGSDDNEAGIVARHLVRANLCGHDSHGVGMIPTYVELWQNGLLKVNQQLEKRVDFGALLAFDAGRGVGQRMAAEAVDAAIERARQLGSCTMALANSSHVGRIGTYSEQCAAAGMISIHFANVADHAPVVAPFGGREARLGTNPFSVGIPKTDSEPLLLDMATSTIAFGKARVARNKGVPTPEGAIVDAQGRLTTDPEGLVDRFEGALTAFGAHKGSGLSIVCELLAAATGGQIMIPDEPRKGGTVNSLMSIVIDASKLVDPKDYTRRTNALEDWLRSSEPSEGSDEVLMPGEPERRSRAARGANGIPVDPRTIEQLQEAARAAGVDDATIASLDAK